MEFQFNGTEPPAPDPDADKNATPEKDAEPANPNLPPSPVNEEEGQQQA